MNAPTCPECGSVLQVIEVCQVEAEHAPGYLVRRAGVAVELPRWSHLAAAALCVGCEFAIEISTSNKGAK